MHDSTFLIRLITTGALLATTAAAPSQSEFVADLRGENEASSLGSDAFGYAIFDLTHSGGVLGIAVELAAFNLPGTFTAHINCGRTGMTGPIVVWLTGGLGTTAKTTLAADVTGTWVGDSKFTSANIVPGSQCGDSLAELVSAMANGETYVYLNSAGNRGREIRGQISQVATITVP